LVKEDDVAGGFWRRSQRQESSNTREVGVDAAGVGDEPEPGEAEGSDGDAAGSTTVVGLADSEAPAAPASEGASMTIARVAEKAAERSKHIRRGQRRPVAATGSANGPASQLVETFEREGARRNDALMRTLQRAQRATTEAHRLRQAVAEAKAKVRLAAQRRDEVRAWLEQEQRSEEASAAQRRRAEAAALEQETLELDQAKAEEKRLRVEAYRATVRAAAGARSDAQRAARERATEARAAVDRAEAVARALEAAVDEVVAASQEEEKRAVAEAETRARTEAEAAAAELLVIAEQRAARIEAFKIAEIDLARERELAADQQSAAAAADLTKSEAMLREFEASLAAVEEAEGNSAREVAAGEAAVAEAEHLAQAAREAEARARRARAGQQAALDGAQGATARATAARTDAERATATAKQAAATAKQAASEAAELLREAEQLSAEASEAEQQAAASARALESPGSKVADEASVPAGANDIDLTVDEADAASRADAAELGGIETTVGEGRDGNGAGFSDINREIS
jgi:hypothetical protein